ncbi:hypothetical protein KM043_018303 [Ampulex compressa]|nr:hypothetical protein KM043_018303 [Ampulex compressa]
MSSPVNVDGFWRDDACSKSAPPTTCRSRAGTRGAVASHLKRRLRICLPCRGVTKHCWNLVPPFVKKMSDEEKETEKPFAVERAKTGRAKCKKCKCPINKDTIRIAKLMANPFSEGKMKAWHHISCLFEVFAKQRATTKKIDDPEEDISGWEDLNDEDRDVIREKIDEFEKSSPLKGVKTTATQAQKRQRNSNQNSGGGPVKGSKRIKVKDNDASSTSATDDQPKKSVSTSTDDAFRTFRRICAEIAAVDAYTEKTAILRQLLTKGTDGDGFTGDIILWCKLLLPMVAKRIYNLQSKQLIKLLSRLFVQDEDAMLEHLQLGDVAETIRVFFEKSTIITPAPKSLLSIQDVEQFLERLSHLTKEEEQTEHFRGIVDQCTANDLKMIIRLIKHDLRINTGPKHILAAVHKEAYAAFQTSRDLQAVIERCLEMPSSNTSSPEKASPTLSSPGGSKVALSLMTPVLPMLAEACKSVEMAMKKCPNGMLSEVKYDGERVQVHKKGTEFRYYSRSLKPVMPHKVNLFKDYIPKAFPGGDDLILDSEVLMIDTKTGKPLPFGSLGIHKKAEFKDANVCLFIFDCLYYNGQVLMGKPMHERKRILKDRMTEIPNRIMLSEFEEVHKPQDLAEMIGKVLKMGLEGLVLKDMNSKYEPGKRHWLKVKKDYLFNGAMADTADLVVLGAWYGTGHKGGMMSIFLMGCYDEESDQWVTVTKVHTGHDDATLEELQDKLDMIKIGKDPNKLPKWLRANKLMVPDFVAKDPKKQPVWEITGAEFTNHGVHTADAISIRFPRVTRIRQDKDWSTATNLNELRHLFQQSSESIDLSLLMDAASPVKRDDDAKTADRDQRANLQDSPVASEKKKVRRSLGLQKQAKIKAEVKDLTYFMKKEDVDEPKPSTSWIKTEIKEEPDSMKEEPCKDGSNDEEENLPKYYAFLGNDYIEYSANGNPLNWIKSRTPPKGLPPDVKPLSALTDLELKSKAIFKDVRVFFAHDFDQKPQCDSWKTLKTLGAKILNRDDVSKSTHVIHGEPTVPSTAIRDYEDVPYTARHVHVDWIWRSASESEMLDVEQFAVKLIPSYCSCPCSHPRRS